MEPANEKTCVVEAVEEGVMEQALLYGGREV